jgi:hypothetical protein
LTRLIRILTLLALVLSPLAMIGAAPAMAHQAATAGSGHPMAGHAMAGHDMNASMAAMAHCKDMDKKSKDQPCGSSDCLTACAAVPAIPAVGGQLEPHALAHGPRQHPALMSAPQGLDPEAATPPPRPS